MEIMRLIVQGALALAGALLCICAGAIMAMICALAVDVLAEYVVVPFALLVLEMFE